MNARGYILIGLVVAAMMFAISTFFGEGIVVWATNLQLRAVQAGQGGFGRLITEPIIFVMTQDIIAAVLITLLWPVVFFWLLLILLLILVITGTNTANDIEAQTRLLLTYWA